MLNSPISLAHHYWICLLNQDDWVIDATCGNGKDTHFLAELVPQGLVMGLDIQPLAIENTQKRTAHFSHVHLFQQSHVQFPPLAYTQKIKLIVYNLGYLPGSGNKTATTLLDSTLFSIKNALELICEGGMVSITCYPGHPEGQKEENALLSHISTLSPQQWIVCHHRWVNRHLSPSLMIIQKKFTILPTN